MKTTFGRIVATFEEGLIELPWLVAQICVAAFVIYSLSGNLWGNSIRCYIFDNDGCKSNLKAEVSLVGNTYNKLLTMKKETNIDFFVEEELPAIKDAIRVLTYQIHIANVGVSNLRAADITIDFLPGNGSGVLAWHSLEKKTRFEGNSIEILAPDFTPSCSRLVKESTTFYVVGFIPVEKYMEALHNLSLSVKCDDCQVTYWSENY